NRALISYPLTTCKSETLYANTINKAATAKTTSPIIVSTGFLFIVFSFVFYLHFACVCRLCLYFITTTAFPHGYYPVKKFFQNHRILCVAYVTVRGNKILRSSDFNFHIFSADQTKADN